jgi:AmmeMemoRadiSam system protein B
MSTRRPAVAGLFYPDDPEQLRARVETLLAGVRSDPTAATPKAVIAPHAGYVYSGPVAASAYALLRPLRGAVRRVVLIGPSHRVPLRGLAAPAAGGFATPLGEVVLDTDALALALALPQVRVGDAAHAREHSLEVQLPFLQCVLGEFALVPLVAGDASDEEVAGVLEALWGGDETRIVISSDLSHYLPYDRAREHDARTTRAIEALDPAGLDWESACGRVPIGGLLRLAQRRGLACRTLDVRNSGDTAGDRAQVVGYGAWAFA